jgi:lipase
VSTLAVHAWGRRDAPRAVFLHGVTAHGAHARALAEEWLGERFLVLAPDLLGHGASPHEPPWSIDAHLDAVLGSVGRARAAWIGHSFGARLAFELAAREPALVECLVLLDPAIHIAPHVALFAAENARKDRFYASFEEAIERRYEESQLRGAPRQLLEEELRTHLLPGEDGLWRYRYCQAAVVAAYGELASVPPPFQRARVPTLLVLGRHSYVPYDHLLDDHRAALGELLTVVTVEGGHTLLWDALGETAGAIAAFLGGARDGRFPPE